MQSCQQVNAAVAPNSGFCNAAASGMKSVASGASACTAACAPGGSCPSGGRRLSENEAYARQLTGSPQVAITFTITFPPGTSAQAAKNAITSIPANTLKNAVTTALTNAGGSTAAFATQVQSMTAPTAPTVAINPAGYDVCVSGAGCYFNFYAVNTHYKIHRASHGAGGFTNAQCAAACTADASCEAYEYLTSPNSPACSFWLKGACNIPAGSPPGYVTGISYATYCDKVGARSAFTPVTSGCKNSNILGLGSVLSAFLMLAMMG